MGAGAYGQAGYYGGLTAPSPVPTEEEQAAYEAFLAEQDMASQVNQGAMGYAPQPAPPSPAMEAEPYPLPPTVGSTAPAMDAEPSPYDPSLDLRPRDDPSLIFPPPPGYQFLNDYEASLIPIRGQHGPPAPYPGAFLAGGGDALSRNPGQWYPPPDQESPALVPAGYEPPSPFGAPAPAREVTQEMWDEINGIARAAFNPVRPGPEQERKTRERIRSWA